MFTININVYKENNFTKGGGPSKIQAWEKKCILSHHSLLNSLLTFYFLELCGISSKTHSSYNPSI